MIPLPSPQHEIDVRRTNYGYGVIGLTGIAYFTEYTAIPLRRPVAHFPGMLDL
jgi:hypothetical protein